MTYKNNQGPLQVRRSVLLCLCIVAIASLSFTMRGCLQYIPSDLGPEMRCFCSNCGPNRARHFQRVGNSVRAVQGNL